MFWEFKLLVKMFLVGLYFYNVYYRNIKLKRDREYKND